MPTSFMDQFWVMDPFAPPPAGTALTVVYLEVIDNNDNDLINRFSNDSIDGSDITRSYPGDTVTVELSDGSTVTITGVTFYLADGREVFTPTDGSNLPNATLVSTTWVNTQGSVPVDDFAPPCFTPGTLIDTAEGPRPVEDLNPGDFVWTADRGLCPIILVNRRAVSAEELSRRPKLAPVRIVSGAMGAGLPRRDLVVSPQHRMLLNTPVARRMFGNPEILVPACQLSGQPGIERVEAPLGVEYIHLLLDHHAVLFAEGAPTESLFMGEQAQQELSRAQVAQLRSEIPQVIAQDMEPARPLVRGRRLKQLLHRHQVNDKPLLAAPPALRRRSVPPRLALVV